MGLYIADCNYLVEIALILNRMDDAAEIQTRAVSYGLKLQELWDDQTGNIQG
jgi:hypothetical protein